MGNWGFVNKKGEEVIPCIYEYTRDFNEGLAYVVKDGVGSFVNKRGDDTFSGLNYPERLRLIK